MKKFTLYDFLSLILPGIIFLFFCNALNELFCVFPTILKSRNLGMDIVISLCFIIIFGAVLYTSSFYLIKKNWYNHIFGMHKLMNQTLNQKANEWYKKDIFFNKKDFATLYDKSKKEINDLQDLYYDQMYYELDYHNKIEHAKGFQSFYFFFRQTALVCVILLLFIVILFSLHFIQDIHLHTPSYTKLFFFSICIIFLQIISIQLAKWYRKSMVSKMYWTFFTHLNQK